MTPEETQREELRVVFRILRERRSVILISCEPFAD